MANEMGHDITLCSSWIKNADDTLAELNLGLKVEGQIAALFPLISSARPKPLNPSGGEHPPSYENCRRLLDSSGKNCWFVSEHSVNYET